MTPYAQRAFGPRHRHGKLTALSAKALGRPAGIRTGTACTCSCAATAARDGADPIAARRRERMAQAAPGRTFRIAAEHLIETHRTSWSNPKHAAQWGATLQTYAYPVIGDMPVQDVSTEHVLAILRPIWPTTSETASRLRGRIEAVLDAARAFLAGLHVDELGPDDLVFPGSSPTKVPSDMALTAVCGG